MPMLNRRKERKLLYSVLTHRREPFGFVMSFKRITPVLSFQSYSGTREVYSVTTSPEQSPFPIQSRTLTHFRMGPS